MIKAKKRWLKLTIKTDPVLVESIEDFLLGFHGMGVESGAEGEKGYGTVVGYLETADPDVKEVRALLERVSGYLPELAGVFGAAAPRVNWTMIEEEDWGRNWKKHFRPFAVLPDLVIAPTWEEYRPAAGERVIEIDPGMAFGTGHHETTAIALELVREGLENTGGKNLTLLDVGTGTGILGMAAVLFGCGEVVGIDNDPEAVSVARKNVLANGMVNKIKIMDLDLAEVSGFYHLVVANIVHDVLVEISDDLARLTANGGYLVLSGLQAGSQLENIRTVFEKKEMLPVRQVVDGEWGGLMLKKKSE
jgi:ribosomal protein L11 methyltransferase